MREWCSMVTVAAVLALPPCGVRADAATPGQTQASEQADEEARGFFIAGRAAYAAQRYAEALERFERSYAMSGRPELLYNIGTAAERTGELARALTAYRAFLEARPDADVRGDVDARIRAIEARIAQGEPASPATAAPTAAEPVSVPRSEDGATAAHPLRAPALALSGAGAVLVGGGTLLWLGLAARERVEGAPDGARYSSYADDYRRAPRFENAGIGLLAVGAVAASVSTWWLWQRRRAHVSASVGAFELRVGGSF